MPEPVQISEEQARAVAEEARESGWEKPSFAKELFLGRLTLDLVHPFPPRPTPDEDARTQEFLTKLRRFCLEMDGASSNATRGSPPTSTSPG